MKSTRRRKLTNNFTNMRPGLGFAMTPGNEGDGGCHECAPQQYSITEVAWIRACNDALEWQRKRLGTKR
ncbi:amidohydrolase [Sesbania bispinosa]|nr:amidohydrolase [Sesbania bispinosa]